MKQVADEYTVWYNQIRYLFQTEGSAEVMRSQNVQSEYSLQGTPERIQYSEYNDLERRNEFNEKFYSDEYNGPVNEYYSGSGKAAQRPERRTKISGLPLLRTVAALVAAIGVMAATVLLPLAVRILSCSAGADFLQLELNVRNKNQVPLTAMLLDEEGDFVEKYRLEPENERSRLLFNGLKPDKTYLFRVVREDNNGVVTEKSYKTLPNDPNNKYTLTLEQESVDYFSLYLAFAGRGEEPSKIIAEVNGRQTEIERKGEQIVVSCEGLSEGADADVTLVDGDNGSILFEGHYVTPLTPAAKASEIERNIGSEEAVFRIRVANPYEHDLSVTSSGENVSFSGYEADIFELTITGLTEAWDYTYTITDNVRETTVLSGNFTTSIGLSARISVKETRVEYDSIFMNFEIIDPSEHGITVTENGEEVLPKMLPENTAVIFLDNLDEMTEHNVVFRDAKTGEDIFNELFVTERSPKAQVSLISEINNYYEVRMVFKVTNSSGHQLKAFLEDKEVPFETVNDRCSLVLSNLTENTLYNISIVDVSADEVVYSGTVTTVATPSAEVSLNETPDIGYYHIGLQFKANNPYKHELKTVFDGGAEQDFETSVIFTGLLEGSSHTVEVIDKITGVTVFGETFTTAKAVSASVTLKNIQDGYTSANIAFEVNNPANHALTVYLGTAQKGTLSLGSNVNFELRDLREKTSYSIRVADEFTGETVFRREFTTGETPAASVRINSSKVSCYTIDLIFDILRNDYNHKLTLEFDGAGREFKNSNSFTGLNCLSTHRVSVKDTNPNTGTVTEIYSGSFTTKAPVDITQDPDGTVYYRLEDDFLRANQNVPCEVNMQIKESVNPDYDFIWFMIDNSGISGVSMNDFIFRGVYTVTLTKDGVPVYSFEKELQYGISLCGLRAVAQGDNLVFTVVSGKLPSLDSGERIAVYLYDAMGTYMDYDSSRNFTYKPDGFSVRLPQTVALDLRTAEFYVEYIRYITQFDYESGIILSSGSVS